MFDARKMVGEALRCEEYSRRFCKLRPAVKAEKCTGLVGEVFEGTTKFDADGKPWDKNVKWFVVPRGTMLGEMRADAFEAEFPEDFKGVYLSEGIFITHQDWTQWGINENNTLIIGKGTGQGVRKDDFPDLPYYIVRPDFGKITANRLVCHEDIICKGYVGNFDSCSKVNNLDVVYPSGIKTLGGDNVVLSSIRWWTSDGSVKVEAVEFCPEKLLPDYVELSESGLKRIKAEEVVEAIGLTPERVKEKYGELLEYGGHSNVIQWGRIMQESQYAGIFPDVGCMEVFGEEWQIREELDKIKKADEQKSIDEGPKAIRGKLSAISGTEKVSVGSEQGKSVVGIKAESGVSNIRKG